MTDSTIHTAVVLSPAPGTAITIGAAPNPTFARLFTPTPKAAKRVLEFFTAQVNNDHTRKAYLNATKRFAGWCEGVRTKVVRSSGDIL